MSETLPMFPLGSVIFPFTAVPLHVFEPRYHALVDAALEQDTTFGSVLIERGFEVGGGDQRFSVGTRLRVVGDSTSEGARFIVVVGTGRIRVERWLDDDPHPWAEVTELPDDPAAPTLEALAGARQRLERLMAVVSEMGEDTSGIDLDVAEDPVVASYQLAALTPVTPIDSYALLGIDDAVERVDRLSSMIDEQIELLLAGLGGP
jgi:Lon protease-like protein